MLMENTIHANIGSIVNLTFIAKNSNNKKLLLRKTARGIQPAAYPVPVGMGEGGYTCPGCIPILSLTRVLPGQEQGDDLGQDQ